MDPLSTFINLIAKTEGRDKFLRLIQYLTLNSSVNKGIFSGVYEQMRRTRKVLRFLRTLQYTTKIRQEVPQLKKQLSNPKVFIKKIFSILENLFTFLFFVSDHRVVLSELGVIDKSQRQTHYPKSMKFYLLQNVFGALKNLLEMSVIIFQQRNGSQKLVDLQLIVNLVKKKAFDLIRCLLDIFVALYYLKGSITAQKAGQIGVVTSIMAILQSLNIA